MCATISFPAGLTPHEEEQGAETEVMSIESEQKSMQSDMTDKRSLRQPVSFDDYHTLWKGIATSLTVYKQQSKLCMSIHVVNMFVFSMYMYTTIVVCACMP